MSFDGGRDSGNWFDWTAVAVVLACVAFVIYDVLALG